MSDPIDLDCNATTPVAREVLDAMLPWLRGELGNPVCPPRSSSIRRGVL